MTIRQAASKTTGIRFFYVRSTPQSTERVVTHIRRAGMDRWTCNCPDFTFRGQLKKSHRACKHVRFARASARLASHFKNLKTVHTHDGEGSPLSRPMTTAECSAHGIALFE